MVDKPEAVGVLHLIWHFTMKFAWRDGDLNRFPAPVVAEAIGWKKDPEMLMRGLQQAGWIDADLKVHDWLDYAGKLVRDRLYNEKRRFTPFYGVNPRKTTATLPNRTQQSNKETLSSNATERLTAFDAFWKTYPRKVGKGAAHRIWFKTLKPDSGLAAQILAAVVAQKKGFAWQKDGGQFIPHPATWLHQQRWLDEVPVAVGAPAPADPQKLEKVKNALESLKEREYDRLRNLSQTG